MFNRRFFSRISVFCIIAVFSILFLRKRFTPKNDTRNKNTVLSDSTSYTNDQKTESNISEKNLNSKKTDNLVLPKYQIAGQLINHLGYTLLYVEKYEQPAFVAYKLTGEETRGNADRSNDVFRSDPTVETESASPEDYKRSGYSRGHLAPAADFRFSDKYMDDTFFMSNVSPQDYDFNAGIWRILEEQVRSWAKKYKTIYVVTGPELKPELKTIGRYNKIAVPEKYYKVILDMNGEKPKMIAFVMENKDSPESIKNFAVTVDHVEKMTGLDFFPALEDEIENELESKVNLMDWTWQKPRILKKFPRH